MSENASHSAVVIARDSPVAGHTEAESLDFAMALDAKHGISYSRETYGVWAMRSNAAASQNPALL